MDQETQLTKEEENKVRIIRSLNKNMGYQQAKQLFLERTVVQKRLA